jgi:hypothetical protein
MFGFNAGANYIVYGDMSGVISYNLYGSLDRIASFFAPINQLDFQKSQVRLIPSQNHVSIFWINDQDHLAYIFPIAKQFNCSKPNWPPIEINELFFFVLCKTRRFASRRKNDGYFHLVEGLLFQT